MNKRILVAYASASGSTREVAEAIAHEIESDDFTTLVQHVNQIENVAQYHGVVLGSSVRLGRWLPEATACLERIKNQLNDKAVAYFTTCLTMADDTAENREIVLNYMEPLLNLTPDVTPIGLGLFAGSLDPDRRAILVGNGPQGDYRNWAAIRTWAREVREQLRQQESTAPLDLAETVLSFTDLSHSELSQVDLQGAELQAANLLAANMEASQLQWADFSHSQLKGANLFQANLIGSVLTGANLEEANLAEATLNGALLQYASLINANLARADLNWVDFSQADLRQANLQQARLGWAKLSDARLDGADLAGARYNDHTIWPEGFAPEEAGCINEGRGPV
ncbi:MAG: pentapeptide repeat-containing protein [Anaerolineaceae bacterium]|nr:pentapeptide repeat-containing protein [Anaerolineaceae bacterium]